MKGSKKIIDRLNELLADELSAISQYMVQSEICASWGYSHLHEALKKQALDEMKHAEKLIERIIFLDGEPAVTTLNINIGKEIEEQFRLDVQAEAQAVKRYNDSIQLAFENGDAGTAEVLKSILGDEERHLDWLDSQSVQIKQIGVGNYLSEQIG